jgi:Ca-activated chloride channel family protein
MDLGQQAKGDPQLTAFAEAGHGTTHRVTSADQIGWALREILTGRSQLVACDARLQVTFNPKSVLEYRLVGHEARQWAGLLPGPLQADFRDGQTATALYEVRLTPDGPGDLATVELTWFAPGDPKVISDKVQANRSQAGKSQIKLTAHVDRREMAPTFSRSAPSLQEAAVVAYAAEALRRSPFLFGRGSHNSVSTAMFHAYELASEADGRLYERPTFNDFVASIQKAIKAKPTRVRRN